MVVDWIGRVAEKDDIPSIGGRIASHKNALIPFLTNRRNGYSLSSDKSQDIRGHDEDEINGESQNHPPVIEVQLEMLHVSASAPFWEEVLSCLFFEEFAASRLETELRWL